MTACKRLHFGVRVPTASLPWRRYRARSISTSARLTRSALTTAASRLHVFISISAIHVMCTAVNFRTSLFASTATQHHASSSSWLARLHALSPFACPPNSPIYAGSLVELRIPSSRLSATSTCRRDRSSYFYDVMASYIRV